LHFWPGPRSYTREPSAEFHTVGSPPLLVAIIDEVCRWGARLALPGEFTLRAFLAGRIDLTQAEAVLGVVDARTGDQLACALDQLAGGLSGPLHRLREQLLAVLAELEAGLDFAEEPIEFIGRRDLLARIQDGGRRVAAALEQLDERVVSSPEPRVVLAGAPNSGKSSLFNALVARYGCGPTSRSIVSPQAGSTRDYVSATLDLDDMKCILVDAAGADAAAGGPIRDAAQRVAAAQHRQADLILHCVECQPIDLDSKTGPARPVDVLDVRTKADLGPFAGRSGLISVSSRTGTGLPQLASEIRRRLDGAGAGAVAATAARCTLCLRETARALWAAQTLVDSNADELLAAEIRAALAALGEVVGAIATEDVLDRIFSQFCIGK
jgi:tRNA modification GTPase